MHTVSVFLDLRPLARWVTSFSSRQHQEESKALRIPGSTVPRLAASNVCNNDQLSTNLPDTCGVPLGPFLGSLLFLLCINDEGQTSHILKYIMSADDTALFHSDTICRLISTMDAGLQIAPDRLSAKTSTRNAQKTNYITARSCEKFTVENHLHWQAHAKAARNKKE